MSTHQELGDYLRRARHAGDPAQPGLPEDQRVRRVPGLRREEVARLAGVSTDYYTRLEQGRPVHPSAQVLNALARALGLDEAGRVHLHDLAGESTRVRRTVPIAQRVRPGLHQLLESLDGAPAMVLGRRTDVLASNRMARALFADFERMRPPDRNYARWMFCSADARMLFLDWEVQARTVVESLRFAVGREVHDAGVDQLVQELTAASEDFRLWWTQNRVQLRTFGTKRLLHPVVGPLTVDYETLTLPGDPDMTLFTYTTAAGTASRQAMDLLGSVVLTQMAHP